MEFLSFILIIILVVSGYREMAKSQDKRFMSSNIGKCPECEVDVRVGDSSIPDSFTVNCGDCGVLLLYKDKKLKNFHETIHDENQEWPKDGKGTRSIDV